MHVCQVIRPQAVCITQADVRQTALSVRGEIRPYDGCEGQLLGKVSVPSSVTLSEWGDVTTCLKRRAMEYLWSTSGFGIKS